VAVSLTSEVKGGEKVGMEMVWPFRLE